MGDLVDFGGSLLECLLTVIPVTGRTTNHPEWSGTEGFLRLGTFGTKTGRVSSKFEQAGHPRWATHSIFPVSAPSVAPDFLIIHTTCTLSVGSAISLPGSPFRGESKELQASSFSHVVHIWCTGNTQTWFAWTNYGSHSWFQPSNSPLLLPKLLTDPFSLPWDFSDVSQALLYFWKLQGHISSPLSSAIEAPLSRPEGAWGSLTTM